jgi:hypothetical protein
MPVIVLASVPPPDGTGTQGAEAWHAQTGNVYLKGSATWGLVAHFGLPNPTLTAATATTNTTWNISGAFPAWTLNVPF